jgi:hypothetical protein
MRELRFDILRPGYRTRQVTLVTTLLDPRASGRGTMRGMDENPYKSPEAKQTIDAVDMDEQPKSEEPYDEQRYRLIVGTFLAIVLSPCWGGMLFAIVKGLLMGVARALREANGT